MFTSIRVNIAMEQTKRVNRDDDFVNGDYDIHWLEKFVGKGPKKETSP